MQTTSKSQSDDAPQAKYSKPKILLLDLPETAYNSLYSKGFNVSKGTLGKPYKVEMSSGYLPLIGRSDVPNYAEQEIIVIDLAYGKLDSGPQGEKRRPDDELDFWGKCDKGFLDPRVIIVSLLQGAFDRTYYSFGGAFIVFADAKTGIELVSARGGFRGLYDKTTLFCDVYYFLSELKNLSIRNECGKEIFLSDTNSPLSRLLSDFLPESMFTCVLDGNHQNENPWRILAINKFKQPVALAKFHKNNGLLVILPQVRDKVAFLERLFAEVLPEMTPHLFPSIEKSKWNHLPEYELPHIIELKARQDNIASKAKKDIADLENEITQENTINGWIHDLLTGTDTKLVVAIKNVFEAFGFEKIIDVDVERDKEGKSRREDLQIQDQSPLLIVDIKGIAAFPHDEDVLQADKHATLRMRELKRVDVVGLSIINHQRHIPPLDRNNVMPFRQELLDIAEEHTLGLMTSWDLYCLYRNFNKLNWSSEQVKPLFYKKGRIFPVPVHYCYIGTIAKAWTDKFGVMIEEGEVSVGDRLAVEFPIEFQEINVNSIRVNNDGVEHVKVGDPAGFLWSTEMPKLKEGMRVFRISMQTST